MTLAYTGDGAQPLLMSTLASGRQAHDLLVVNPGARQLQVAFREDAQGGSVAAGAREAITFDTDSQPVAALPMRLNVHGRPGLVVLRQGHPEPVIVVVESHMAFNVNTTADTDDAAAGNGTCADSGGNCSLRAAVQEANVHAGADMITFASALNGVPIQLTQVGDDNTAAQGDLDINSDITIVGNGAANTIIQGSSNAAFTGNMGDKIFGINQDGTFSTLNVSLSGLTVRFTRNSNPIVGTFTETGGALDIFLTGTGAMPGPTTTLTNCTFDSNANMFSYGGAINIDSGDLMGGTNIFRGTVQITGCTISNNDTLNTGAGALAFGGGVNLFADRHNVTFTNTTIMGNQTSANIGSNGGGINIRHSNGGTVTLNTCTISNNISGSDGGGILIAGVGGQTVNMTGGSISGNTAQGTGGDADGGGLFNGNPVGSTTLSGVTISNNTATTGSNARGGGIHDGSNAPLTINNCVISGNASDNGGGVATTNAFVNQLTTITNCTISGNSATVAGGALFVSSGTMMANLNRIVNNTAPAGSGIAQTGGTASVENNWWQCDGFPNAAGCQTGSGTFDADPRIDLRLLPASATLALGGTQTFTADVSQNTNGVAINPVVLNGLTITFSGGGLGSVAPGSAALSNLTAGTLFTAVSTCPTPNTGNVSATLDNGTQTSSMTVQVPPAISACPANRTVNTDPGTCTASVSFTPPTVTAGCPAPTVTCRIGATPITSPHAFPVGTSTVTCTASNGVAPDASCSFTVTVNDMENPAITCPANITATENPVGSGTAVVTYTAPAGTDACTGATTVQTAGLASGSTFPVGVTTNTFRVTDAAGNTATCSFTVTVVLAPDLTVTKGHTGNFTQGQTGATYTMTVTNSGGSPTSGTVTLTDSVPSGLVATAASGTGWTCSISPAPVSCTRSDPLAPAASYSPITLTVNVAPNAPPFVTNTATIAGGGEVNTTNNTATDVTAVIPGPDLTVSKSHTGNFIQGQTGAQFTVTVTNSGGSPTSGAVTLADNLPTGLTPTAASGSGWTCGVAAPMVNCSRSDPLSQAASYAAVTITVNVAPNAPPSLTNTATIAGGGDVTTTNNTATDVVMITPGPDLIISKSHTGNFTQGQTGAQFTVTVNNNGGSPTSGAVTLIDNLPTGLTPTGASGTGWTCGVAGATVNCTRSDPLPLGSSYPVLTITVNVAPNAPPSVTNTATIAGGGDVISTNNTATDVVTITPGPDLIISKSHTGNFIQGQTGALFTVTVTNSGGSPTSGMVTVTDTVPPGLVPTAGSGTGWTCGVAGATVNCTRSEPLIPAASYPLLTITVNVAPNAPLSVTNTATISGGGDVNTANNTATDVAAITPGPDLVISKSHTGIFTTGQTGAQFTVTVTNSGGSPTSGAVTLNDNVPAGLTPTAASGAGWTCGIAGAAVNCTRSDPLAPAASYGPVTLTVNVALNAPPSLTNTATIGGGGDVNTTNNTATDTVTILPGPDLIISKNHSGSFIQGQTGAIFTITVTNVGGMPTTGTATLNDGIPPGLIPTAAAGPGWTCGVAGAMVNCSRGDALMPGLSYPPVMITVDIAPNAPPSVTNTATITGGGDANITNNTATDVVTIIPGPDLVISKSHPGNFTPGQTGAQFTVTVTNSGGSPTNGAVTMVDSVPAGLIPTMVGGPGWTCSISGATVNCTRSDPLAPGAGYGPVTLTVDVATNAPPSVTNTATIAGGADVNTANNTATDVVAIIIPGPDLTVSISHSGNFIPGQTGGVFTVIVTNTGVSPTNGVVTLMGNVPSGLTLTTVSGTGWTCGVAGAMASCSRSDPLAAGASYAPLTLTVNVATDAPPSVINTVSVAGGGDVNPANNTASDTAIISRGSDLSIVKSHPNSFGPGQSGVVFVITVSNRGVSSTEGVVDVVDDVPNGLTVRTAGGPGWACGISGKTVTCSRSDALAPGASYPVITLTVDVASDIPVGSTVTNIARVSGGGDANPANNTAEDSETLLLRPDLSITKTHLGIFTRGQTGATFTITVSNTGQVATDGAVRVEDSLPAGLRPTSAFGAGWPCTLNGQTVTCTRSDPLAAGGSYPPITLLVTVAADALGALTNVASVSGGGDERADSASDVTLIGAGGPYTFGQVTVGGGYSTALVLSNTGSTTATGTLILTDQNGNPFPVSLTDPSAPAARSSSLPRREVTGSSFPYSVPSGGTRILQISAVEPSEPLRIGSARLVASAGVLSGSAYVQVVQNGFLRSAAGISGGQPVNAATIVVDNDNTQGRFTGFAVTNPANDNINIKLFVLDENGVITDTLSPPELNPLGPLHQVSRFLHEYLPSRLRFKGSMVLVGQGGKTFSVVALIQYQAQLTAVPVIPSKAPQVPD
jgi:CSLREA domain-containing protein/uncharacterized repeat protein (TIGR01451 family)